MSFPTLRVEAAFGGAPGTEYLHLDDAARGKFDTGLLAPDAVFTDITADVRGVSTKRGRQRLLESFGAGTCEIVLDNSTGDYDPNNLSGLYVSAGASLVKPMVRVRVRADRAGTVYDLFYGFADEWDTSWPSYGKDAICVLRATDGFKVLARHEPGAASASAGASEGSGTRIGRILTSAGWPATDRDLDTGNSTVQATTLASGSLAEMQDVALSEGGYLFVSASGKVTFRDRHSRIEDSRSINIQATFDDDGTDLAYSGIAVFNDDDLIKNSITATRTGGAAQAINDSTSIGAFFTRTYNVTGMWLETDAEVLNWATWVLNLFKTYETRVDSLTLHPQRADALWPIALGSEFGDLMRVLRRPGSSDVIDRYVFLEGVEHQIGPKSWETRFTFSSASGIYASWMILDNTVSGKFDTGKFAPY